MTKLATIVVPVQYDPDVTDADALARALDLLLATAAGTPGILEDFGNPEILPTTLLEPRDMKVHGTPGPNKERVLFRAMTACPCGCGAKNRFEFQIAKDAMIIIEDPVAIRALIDEMEAGYKLLFPEAVQDENPGNKDLWRKL